MLLQHPPNAAFDLRFVDERDRHMREPDAIAEHFELKPSDTTLDCAG